MRWPPQGSLIGISQYVWSQCGLARAKTGIDSFAVLLHKLGIRTGGRDIGSGSILRQSVKVAQTWAWLSDMRLAAKMARTIACPLREG